MKSHYSFPNAFKAGLLIIACLTLPGCINSADNPVVATASISISAGNNLPNIFHVNTLFILNRMLHGMEQSVTASPDYQAANGMAVTDKRSDEPNTANDLTVPNEKRTTSHQNIPVPTPALNDGSRFDMHDNSEEENNIHINFSRVMRIVIMILFAVLII